MKLFKLVNFALFYLKEIILSNLRVAHDVLTPTHYMKPGFVAVPLEPMSDLQLLILTNLITMTPGTLSMDVSTDRKTLYIHAMYVDDAGEFKTGLSKDYIKRIKEVF